MENIFWVDLGVLKVSNFAFSAHYFVYSVSHYGFENDFVGVNEWADSKVSRIILYYANTISYEKYIKIF